MLPSSETSTARATIAEMLAWMRASLGPSFQVRLPRLTTMGSSRRARKERSRRACACAGSSPPTCRPATVTPSAISGPREASYA